MRSALFCVLASALFLQAQSGKSEAPKDTDFTGNWVAQITEDWRWRMVTPAKGDYASIPINMEGRKKADTWDPRADEAAGEQCRSYGAPALLRLPLRLRINWRDDNTLAVETDMGKQTRLLHFGNSTAGSTSLQGDSLAKWEYGRPGTTKGALKVVTTHLKPGYLRKNGVPYSESTILTEFFDVERMPDGAPLLVVTLLVHDPTYLQKDWVTAVHFKQEKDGSKWDPQPCSSTW